jgi:4-amino-4-deoxy-L-arabinose transferase-like glycosyltransferase
MLNQILGSVTVIACILIYFLSYRSYRNSRINNTLILIIAGGLVLRVFAGTDLYLHTWDEQFHALVAKNLLKHPLVPTLYDDPVLSYDYRNWTGNHIWLHKQPVPLWFMALGIKLFGVNEIAIRIPSIILSTIAIFLTFYIGRYLFSERTGLLAAFFHSINGLIIVLTGGRVATDHIDIFFLFFIELSVFLSILSVEKRNILFSVLTGIGIGLAILSKWLPALIVLPLWIILAYKKMSIKDILLRFLIISAVLTIVFLPWQLYIFKKFPLEANRENSFNLLHITSVIEGHKSTIFYHFYKAAVIWNEFIYLALIWIIFKAFKTRFEKKYMVLSVWIFVPYLFFSLVKTRMQGYLLFAGPAMFIVLSAFLISIQEYDHKYFTKFLKRAVLIICILLSVRYTIERVKPFDKRERNPEWTRQLRSLNKIEDGNVVLFNIENNIRVMFYTDHIVYPFIPADEQVDAVTGKGYKIYINDNDNLPDRITNNPDINIFRLDSLM